MNDLEIKQGTEQDVHEILALYDAVIEYLESHTNYTGWKKEVYPTHIQAEEGVKEGTLYIALSSGRIAGSVIINQKQEDGYELIPWKTAVGPEEVAVIHTFLVHPDYLKAGVGRTLLEFAEKRAVEEGRKTIRLDVYDRNEPAIRLYESLGYEHAGTADLGYEPFLGLKWFRVYEKSLQGRDQS
ncbi:N-acetyltransferase family protein [Lacrimispora sp.]|uniref:GNAT family N-acetyltransferase n=1 Tax=Lacrimispora sp. TaxID=2719234 RepID=UPI0034600A09